MECFGWDRVMFGGDWPLSTQASDYPRWVNTLDAALKGATPEQLRKVYVTNAEAFYRI
jgi:L-fuconolactonase